MKCETCDFNCVHRPGSFYSVAEGGDDPYLYAYCAKGHWSGPLEEEELPIMEDDPWADCTDYRPNREHEPPTVPHAK